MCWSISRLLTILIPDVGQDELLRLPGIDPDKARLYGKQFCKLIQTAHSNYESMMASKNEDEPSDPNHHLVIDLSSDDDDVDVDTSVGADRTMVDRQNDLENFFVDDDDDDDDVYHQVPSEERSGYFQQRSNVDAFNAQC